ncbi:MAG: sigma 54-dependent Fis family transcriptional regulator [Deltaproteobacteria bacterium]|nr:sigma 54-dependent Fis family transcriptional regulator [Deltaproteobacteria bacterium]
MVSKPPRPLQRLVVTLRGDHLLELPLEGCCLGIGSGEDNNLRLAGCGVEKHHLVLRRRGRRWVALARGEANLLARSGKVVRQVVLAPGVRVRFGDFSLEVTRDDPGAGPGTETRVEPLPPRSRTEMVLLVPGASGPRHVQIDPQGASIGRGRECDVVLADSFVSRLHLRIQPAAGGWVVTDQGSRNGTRVDGHLVDGAEVRPGSLLALGRTVIECVGPEVPPGDDRGWLETPGLRRVIHEVDRCAAASLPVLLVGDSGVGKEGLARRLHARGPRASGPFVPVNCGALPESLADSLLFGHVRGAFTGAHEHRSGLVQASSGGTLFLDEVGELSAAAQARLLRVIEEGAVRPLGSNETESVDLRIVAATHRDLPRRVYEGAFRLDLLHRLAVLTLNVPPLMKRRADIPVLARWLLGRCEVGVASISSEAMEILKSHSWPGNVRELRNVLSSGALRAGGGVILPSHLVFMEPGPGPEPGCNVLPTTTAEARDLLVRSGGNVALAARSLGVARSTLRDQLRRLEVPRQACP